MASPDTHRHNWYYTEFDDRNFQIRGRTLFTVIVVFSAFLLITILFLYARWFCIHRHQRAAPDLAHAPPSQPQGLDSSTINGFPVVLHQSTATKRSVEESECSICLGAFEDGDKVKVLPNCEHFYHPECVDKWLTDQSSCPLCRSSLRVGSPV